jgi:hypothetical protein
MVCINQKTADALGLNVSALLAIADEVIEAMSAIGTKRHFAAPQNSVAIGCIADIVRHWR